MNDVALIKEAAQGLRYISETDHPFEVRELDPNKHVAESVLALCNREPGTQVEKQTLDYFFRNMVKVYPGASDEEQALAKRFMQLQVLLQQKLEDVEVYRLGEITIDAVIAGKLENGNLLVLKTKLVET